MFIDSRGSKGKVVDVLQTDGRDDVVAEGKEKSCGLRDDP